MNKPIEVGDLVQVVRCCCVPFLHQHSVFKVGVVYPALGGLACRYCETGMPAEPQASAKEYDAAFPLTWLRRIPPPGELGLLDETDELEQVK